MLAATAIIGTCASAAWAASAARPLKFILDESQVFWQVDWFCRGRFELFRWPGNPYPAAAMLPGYQTVLAAVAATFGDRSLPMLRLLTTAFAGGLAFTMLSLLTTRFTAGAGPLIVAYCIARLAPVLLVDPRYFISSLALVILLRRPADMRLEFALWAFMAVGAAVLHATIVSTAGAGQRYFL